MYMTILETAVKIGFDVMVTLVDGLEIICFLAGKLESSDKQGFSKETFLCAKQTSSSMVGLIPYLLNGKKLDYVLTGNLQSDPLEGRFGRYRRSAGTNYFISVRQILEAEKAIRIQSLVSIDGDGFNVKEIREIFSDISAEKSMEVEINSGLITEYWHENKMEFSSLQKGDEGIKYYCEGLLQDH